MSGTDGVRGRAPWDAQPGCHACGRAVGAPCSEPEGCRNPPSPAGVDSARGGEQHAGALRGLRNLKVLLGTDSPEVRGWAPAVQQAAQKAINAAIRVLADGDGVGACAVQPLSPPDADGSATKELKSTRTKEQGQ